MTTRHTTERLALTKVARQGQSPLIVATVAIMDGSRTLYCETDVLDDDEQSVRFWRHENAQAAYQGHQRIVTRLRAGALVRAI